MSIALSEQQEGVPAVELLPPRAKLKLLWMAPRPAKWRLMRGLLTCASPQKVSKSSSPHNWHCTVGFRISKVEKALSERRNTAIPQVKAFKAHYVSAAFAWTHCDAECDADNGASGC